MNGSGPLAGLRVVDLTQMLAGPYATMVLADLGADVVKLEPISGDGVRGNGPFLPDDQLHSYGGYFQSVNRNKRSIAVDLKQEAGREIVLRLVDDAAVLVENYRVGVMDRLGLGYESLHERNPRLVYAAIRGFGDPRTGASPYSEWPAYDVVAQAMGGLMGITGADATHPTKAGPGVGDIFPAVLAVVGVLAAVRHADHTGEGQFVDVAMYDGVLALCERIVYQHSYTGANPGPQGNGHPMLCPFDVFPSTDGWITIAAPRDHLWRQLCIAMGRPELAVDQRYATNAARVAHCDEVRTLVGAWTSARSNQEILHGLSGRVPCGPVNTAADLFTDPHVAAREMLIQLEHPGSATSVMVAGSPIKMTGTPAAKHRRAPKLNEDADDILHSIGYSADQITQLRATVAVGATT